MATKKPISKPAKTAVKKTLVKAINKKLTKTELNKILKLKLSDLTELTFSEDKKLKTYNLAGLKITIEKNFHLEISKDGILISKRVNKVN